MTDCVFLLIRCGHHPVIFELAAQLLPGAAIDCRQSEANNADTGKGIPFQAFSEEADTQNQSHDGK